MRPLVRNLLALAAGLAVSISLISAVQFINGMLYPLPPEIDITKIGLDELMVIIPLPAMLMVELSYILGSLGGGFTVGTFAHSHHHIYALTLGALLTVANVVNIMSIPHPLWMSILTMITFIPVAYLGSCLAHKA